MKFIGLALLLIGLGIMAWGVSEAFGLVVDLYNELATDAMNTEQLNEDAGTSMAIFWAAAKGAVGFVPMVIGLVILFKAKLAGLKRKAT